MQHVSRLHQHLAFIIVLGSGLPGQPLSLLIGQICKNRDQIDRAFGNGPHAFENAIFRQPIGPALDRCPVNAAAARCRYIQSNSSFWARVEWASSSTKKLRSNSIPSAVIDLTPINGAGISRINRVFSMACRRISALVAGDVLASSRMFTVTPWMPEGELVLMILALAIVLLGMTARSRFAVRTCVARQFISMTRPSVLPSMLIQSPGR